MNICMVIVAIAFNILVIFSLSLSLVALTLTSFSIFLIWSNQQTSKSLKPLPPTNHHLIKSSLATAANQIISCHHRYWTNHQTSKSSPLNLQSSLGTPDLLLIPMNASPIADRQSPRSLSDRWSPRISRCLISGFRVDFSLFDLSPIAIAIFFLCLMVLISEFNDFDQWVLMILISGFWLVVLGLWWVGWWWRLAWWWWLYELMDAGLMIAIALIVDGGWVLS